MKELRMDANLPDFLIIGAAKSGTTSLYYYLQQHPEIFMPANKEPFYFSFMNEDVSKYYYAGNMNSHLKIITSLENYYSLFKPAPKKTVKGEASTLYLSDPKCPKRIFELIPSVKLIAILRNPIDRAYSHFQHFRKDKIDPILNFRDALLAEEKRKKENWFPTYFYTQSGFYFQQLTNYYKLFPKSQLKIFLYEDLQYSETLLRDIFQHIGVNPEFPVETNATFNRSGNVRFSWLYQLVRYSTKVKPMIRSILPARFYNSLKNRWDKVIMTKYEAMANQDREYLKNIFRDDILSLQSLIGRDLSHWL